ncbi:MAG: helix-turn-helix domain-containing protein [Clostridiales Family XIII bacterium]|jgi:AraC-like DNA-binding protein|nr:helix-turn-helix domain-containing protein [Clostridiales Family XIII bacterium]
MNRKIEFAGLPLMLELKSVKSAGPFFHRDALELLFIVEGEAEVWQRMYGSARLRTGDFAIIDAGMTHSVKCDAPCRVISLYLDLNYFEEAFPYIHGISFMFRTAEETGTGRFFSDVIRDYMIRLLIVRHHDMPFWEKIFTEVAEIMITLLCLHFENTSFLKSPLKDLKKTESERILAIIEFISKNYARRDITIKDIADAINLSPSRAAHFWKEVINISLQQSVSMNRLHESARMLVEGDMPIVEIAERCGYSDEKYMYGGFKKQFGMTPNEYRQQNYFEYSGAGNFEFFVIEDEYAIVKKYSDAYFTQLDNFDFLPGGAEKRKTEENLFRLYGYILKERECEALRLIRKQECCLFSMEPAKGLQRRGVRYTINWEYVYGLVFWFNEMDLKIQIRLQYALMAQEEWEELIRELWSEILREWGGGMKERVEWILFADDLNDCPDAWAFAEGLRRLGGEFRTTFVL